jgi:2-isopropylmalate synthase
MKNETIRIYDTSLRDGLRNSGIAIDLDDKVRFIRQLERLGVSDIEVGFGGPSQVEVMTRLAGAVTAPVLYGLSRVNRRDVDRVLDGLAGACRPGVNIFSPTSEAFLGHAGQTPAQALKASVKAVEHAKSGVEHVVFSAQDAPRAERSFLHELLDAVIAAGATAISVADTTSQAMPSEFGRLCGELRDAAQDWRDVILSVHCHNGLGLAVANSAAAIENGARQVECTINGIGESGSNTSLQAIARLLQRRADAFPNLRCGLDLAAFEATELLLAEIARPSEDANSDVVDLLRRQRGGID